VIGPFFSLKLLSLASVLFGRMLLFDMLLFFCFPLFFALLIAIQMGIVGFWTQDRFEERGRQGHKFASWSRNIPPSSAVKINFAVSTIEY